MNLRGGLRVTRKRTLLLMRHGKSSWAAPLQADFDRPLKARGQRAAEQMARWIGHSAQIPDTILTSPAVRARDTAEIVHSGLRLGTRVLVEEPRIYEANPTTLLYCIGEHGGDATTLMLIGHNPGLEMLTLLLATDEPAAGHHYKLFPTATVAVLEYAGEWTDLRPQSCKCATIARPRELDAASPSE